MKPCGERFFRVRCSSCGPVWLSLALFACLARGFASAPALQPGPGVYFVSPAGNDQWSGTRPAANFQRSDGPLATVPAALAKSRQWRSTAGTSAITPRIVLRGGNYFLNEPLVLKPGDSGLTIEAYANEKPVLSGGRLVSGWKEETVGGQTVWSAPLPQQHQGSGVFRELWVNGIRATRARHPNHGYFKVAALPDKTAQWTDGQMRFTYHPGDIPEWKSLPGAEVVVMSRWVESRLPIYSMAPEEHVLRFTKRSVFQLEPGDLYYLEGARQALDAPGEWVLDREAGKVLYVPRSGQRLKALQAIAPRLSQVVRLEGQPEAGRFIEDVRFRRLTFGHSEWCFPEGFAADESKPHVWPPPQAEVGGFAQAAIGVPGAVWGEGARNCVWEGCAFTHLGDYGLELARGCQSNRVVDCDFSDLGAGGIKLGETSIRKEAAAQTRGNEITNCSIHEGGKMFHSAIGIWIGQSPDNRLTHNLIHDFYYTGISIGWTWGYGPAMATNNLVAFNHVHHIGVKSDGDGPILSDMGGIYTLGMQPGTRIVNNLWHDIAGLRYGGWGIYFDEGSSSILAVSNLVYHTTHGGFHQHYGATNMVWNNIFAFGRDFQIARTRTEPHMSFSFQTNIVYFDSGVLLGGNWSDDEYKVDWNDYFDARPEAKPLSLAGVSLEQWRTHWHDEHSVVADPRFFDPKKDDFRLRADSPALKLGFQPINDSTVGPLQSPGRR